MENQQRHLLIRVLFSLVIGLGVVFFIPLELPVGMDLSQALLSVQSVLNGGDIYGVGVSRVITDPQSYGLVGTAPFAGPPWSFSPLLALGLFSPERAPALWFVVSILCLCASVTIVASDLSPVLKTALVIAALVSAPVQGHLIVGQITLPTLLGVALLVAGHRSASPFVMGVGISLIAFRPHLGLPVVVAWGLFMLLREPKQLLVAAAYATAIVVCLGGFAVVVDPTCLRGYSELVVAVNALPSNKVCDTCSSLPVLLTDRSPNAPNSVWTERFIIAGLSVLMLGYPLARRAKSLAVVVSGAVCVSLLSAPYNRNYDYVLLVVPLVIIGRHAWALRACGSVRSSRALVLVATGAIIAGVLPYLLSRTAQGYILWLSALCGYMAALVVAQGAQEPKVAI